MESVGDLCGTDSGIPMSVEWKVADTRSDISRIIDPDISPIRGRPESVAKWEHTNSYRLYFTR
jgi:hypothetical protein